MSRVREVGPVEAAALAKRPGTRLVDVREPREWDAGRIPGAIHVPLGSLERTAAERLPDRQATTLVYCAAGVRSLKGAAILQRLGYGDVASVAGGIVEWQGSGLPVEAGPPGRAGEGGPGEGEDGPERSPRYSRHVRIPEVGEEGQRRLLASSVLVVGAGGLGSPVAYYLAAAGVGRLGVVDSDRVEVSNLQRQILHSTERIGAPKAQSAKRTLEALDPNVRVEALDERLTSANADRILPAYDVVVDGADNFPTRYLLNDAALKWRKPVVHGSVYRFEGQVTVFRPFDGAGERGPCYRCLFRRPPPPELAPSCEEAGVLGVLPGVIGTLQAAEALKLLLGIGDPLVGRYLLFDALEMSFREVRLRRDPDCPACGTHPTISSYIDYEAFCAAPSGRAAAAAR